MTNTFKNMAPLALLAMPLAGCGGGMSLASAQVESPIIRGAPQETRQLILDCAAESADGQSAAVDVSPQAFTGGSVLGAFATDFIFNLVENGLEQAQARRNAAYAISGIANKCNFAKIAVDPGDFKQVSLVLERAQWSGRPTPALSDTPAFQLKANLFYRPRAVGNDKFLELELQPTNLIYGRTAAQTRGKGQKRVIVLIGFSDNTALGSAAATSETPIASALRLDFGKLQDGRYYPAEMIDHLKTTALIPMPASTSPVVTALVVETEDEILALKALTSAFQTNRDALASLIADGKDD